MPYQPNYSTDEPKREEIDRSTGPLIMEFGADWCPHCQALAPRLEKAMAMHSEVMHIKIADGKGKRLGRSFGVKLWPNLVFLRDGVLLKQFARPSDAELQEGIESLFPKKN